MEMANGADWGASVGEERSRLAAAVGGEAANADAAAAGDDTYTSIAALPARDRAPNFALWWWGW